MEAIILAGGLGTRLRTVVSDKPKCMADVNGQPFLYYILRELERAEFSHIILSLGYLHHVVLDWLETQTFKFKISHVIEEQPLGTGGAIQFAMQKSFNQNVFVLNGDSFVTLEYKLCYYEHMANESHASIVLYPMSTYERYGTVFFDNNNNITSFLEKSYQEFGYINSGIYILNKPFFNTLFFPEKFSIEQDFFEKYLQQIKCTGYKTSGLFIDIGIPEDYNKAQTLFA